MLLMRRNMSCMASVLRYAEYGEPSKVLKLCSENLEAPRDDKLLVKILLAPINPADVNTIQGIRINTIEVAHLLSICILRKISSET
jgi:NADPH:quinone reductase-like Zn-dependent oxidoreductase